MYLSHCLRINYYVQKIGGHRSQWTIYSATTFLEKCRKVVREIWFEKSGSRKVVDQKKRWFYTINPHFFWFEKSGWPEKKIRVCRTTTTTFLEKWLQNKWSIGCATNRDVLLLTTLRYSELENVWLISILWRLSTAKQQQPTLWIWRSLAALCSITKECLSSYGTLLHAFSPTTHHYTPGTPTQLRLACSPFYEKGIFDF